MSFNIVQALGLISQSLGGTTVAGDKVQALDNIHAALLNNGQNAFNAGTYTPVATNSTNVASFQNVYDAQWSRMKNVVTVSGIVRFTTTLAAPTFTGFVLTLPFAANFLALGGITCAGAMVADPGLFTPQLVIGDGAAVGRVSMGGVAITAPGIVLASYIYSYITP